MNKYILFFMIFQSNVLFAKKMIQTNCIESGTTIAVSDNQFKPDDEKPNKPLDLLYVVDLDKGVGIASGKNGDSFLTLISERSNNKSFYLAEKTEIGIIIFHVLHIDSKNNGTFTIQKSLDINDKTILTSLIYGKCSALKK